MSALPARLPIGLWQRQRLGSPQLARSEQDAQAFSRRAGTGRQAAAATPGSGAAEGNPRPPGSAVVSAEGGVGWSQRAALL